jgi:hypothetical protein
MRTTKTQLHTKTDVKEISATIPTVIWRRNPLRIKGKIMNEEGSPRYDIRYAEHRGVTFTGTTMGILLPGGKADVFDGDESIPAVYAVGDGVNSVTIVISETFKSGDIDDAE